MPASSSPLTPLQLAILQGMGPMDGVFLTGGSCLSHVYLQHRRSLDIDFFAVDQELIPEIAARLRDLCDRHGWTVQIIREFPGFRRYEVHAATEQTLVDMAHDAVPQLVAWQDKPMIDGFRVDDLRDIVANKLTAVLGRSDTKDLVDLCVLERRGRDVLASMDDALRKDAGIDPAVLAWVLRTMSIDIRRLWMVEALSETELRDFRDDLVRRLVLLARPQG